jgi:hypothetical protein
MTDFANDDKKLRERAERAREERTRAGLDGLVGGLDAVVINTEPAHLKPAVEELLGFTGLDYHGAFVDGPFTSVVLRTPGSADFLVRCRERGSDNPFAAHNDRPKSASLPNTRLETYVFRCHDLERYVAIQQGRGVRFMTEDIQRRDNHDFIQTMPSPYTGNSVGLVQWRGEPDFLAGGARVLDCGANKPDRPWLGNIRELDHCATRVRAEERDAAIVEFMGLTNYDFDFSVYVKSLNSITNVTRLGADDFALVFTSGIRPFVSLEQSGPTEKFIHNYGVRTHHMAFRTENIDDVFKELKNAGMEFLVELVGSREDGLQQTFTRASPHTLLVNEYIRRYDGFDGFFTRSNVTELTRATDSQ